MAAIRVSASDIDSFRYFMADEEGDLAGLLARLRRQEPPSEAMLAGTALHAALETCRDGSMDEVVSDGFRFTFAFDEELDIPPTREMKATREYEIGGHAVTLVGKVDAVLGRRIDDHKFTSRYDPERFLGSYQWRIYLDIFGADLFRWNVFEGRETGDRHYTINHLHKLTMHRYPGMGDDIQRELSAFVEFLSVHMPERLS
ncbi:hypothetical protein [Enterovirga sp. CN4-39]|uniref:hypothetical protein n=1 Tax=Enterovirga sp. CN4-39 TaxID=3400910 RepID=UPI003C06CC5C